MPLEQLVTLYMHYLTVALLAAADTFSHYYIEAEKLRATESPDYGTVSFQVSVEIFIEFQFTKYYLI